MEAFQQSVAQAITPGLRKRHEAENLACHGEQQASKAWRERGWHVQMIPESEPVGTTANAMQQNSSTFSYLLAWLDQAKCESLYCALLAQIPWQTHRIRMFGKWVDSPRLSCWIGDPQARYRYSGTTFEPQPWSAGLLALCERLEGELGMPFNSVLANLYRDGGDAMGWHSDDEPELGAEPVIASVSLGAARRFLLRRRDDHAVRQALVLEPGSLLVMRGHSQRDWQHALPRTAKPVGPRINLTFRHVAPIAGRG